MANQFNNTELKASFSVDLLQNDSSISEISTDISLMVVELLFPDAPDGQGTVFTSIDSLEKVRLAIENEDDSNLKWTEWDLGNVTSASAISLLSGYAPTAIKFSNTSLTASTVTFNFRGIFGGR